jgi:hypothetical protein
VAGPAVALAVVLLLGLVVRAQATLLPDLIVGADGAYYLIQVRAILRDGHLAVLDLPLLFYAQAAVARCLALIVDPRAAVVAAVRWTDTLIPLLLALPVYRFARSFAGAAHRGARVSAAVLLVGLVAVVSGNALGMAGGMIKSAAAMPFSLLFVAYVHDWLRHGARRALGPGRPLLRRVLADPLRRSGAARHLARAPRLRGARAADGRAAARAQHRRHPSPASMVGGLGARRGLLELGRSRPRRP